MRMALRIRRRIDKVLSNRTLLSARVTESELGIQIRFRAPLAAPAISN
jgi:hypothetical protein